jgi:mRNA interferase HicA
MKRVDLVKIIEGCGCELVRRGHKHDWYRNSATGMCQPIPRHREINERLARHIIKSLGSLERGHSDAAD